MKRICAKSIQPIVLVPLNIFSLLCLIQRVDYSGQSSVILVIIIIVHSIAFVPFYSCLYFSLDLPVMSFILFIDFVR